MPQPTALFPFKRFPFRPADLLSCLLTSLHILFRPQNPLKRDDVPPCAADVHSQSESFQPEADQLLLIDPGAVCEHLVDLTHHLRSLLPDSCEWLEEGTLEVVGEHPAYAGGVADVWAGKMGNRKIAIKAYRWCSSSNYLPTYVKFYKEALACSRLKSQNIVPFIGVYSTPKHPLTLVFEFMDQLNLKEYLRNNKGVGRRELLLKIARGVKYMHELDVVHGNLKTTNILIDSGGHAHIAGLGVALLPSTMPGVDVDRFFHGAAPELVDPRRFRLANTGATTASDVYAFGVLAWEVFAGQVPFPDSSRVAGVYSMLEGRRPGRPDHPEVSDRVWSVIEGCWKVDPARRKTMAEVVAVLGQA